MQETVTKYDLLALPVVDKDGMLEGIITVDDVMETAVPGPQRPGQLYRLHRQQAPAREEGSVNPRMVNLSRRFWIFLAIMGPGIITANVDNDAGGITTYSVAGASFGFKFLWIFIPMTIALIVVQEMCARMGAVTGKGLSDLIRERFGVKVIMFVMMALMLADLGNTVSEFAGVAASGEIFNISKYIIVPIVAFLVWFIVIKGSYKMVERVFLVASALYLCYIPSAIMAKPHWGVVFKEMVVPSFSFNRVYLAMLIGLIGTTIAPWMQFYIQSAVVEKGITAKDYEYSRMDVIVGCFMTDIIAVFIVVACAATLFVHNIKSKRPRTRPSPCSRWPAGGPACCSASACSTPRSSRPRSCPWPPLTTSVRRWASRPASTSSGARRRSSTGSIPAWWSSGRG